MAKDWRDQLHDGPAPLADLADVPDDQDLNVEDDLHASPWHDDPEQHYSDWPEEAECGGDWPEEAEGGGGDDVEWTDELPTSQLLQASPRETVTTDCADSGEHASQWWEASHDGWTADAWGANKSGAQLSFSDYARAMA